MTHLVLGSEGLIGGYLVKSLLEKSETVIEFDIKREKNEDLRLFQNELFMEKIRECDFVHFLAFDVGGSNYMKRYQDSYEFISNNIKIMNNVFDGLKKTNKSFIFASSQMSNMLHSQYGILKSIGEGYTRALKGLIVKFWNVYGFERDEEKSHVITDFIKMAKNNKEIIMKTDGAEERQFLYGSDCAEALLSLVDNYNDLRDDQSYDVTSFKWHSIREIAQIISEEFGRCPITFSKNKDTIQKNIKNEPDKYILNFWEPKTNIRNGIKHIINEYK